MVVALLRRAAVVADHSLSQGTPHRAAFKRAVAAVRAVELFPVRVGYFPALCDVVASVEPLDAGGSSGFRSWGLLLHGGVAMLLAAGACLLYLSDGSAAGSGLHLVMRLLRSLAMASEPGCMFARCRCRTPSVDC